MNLAKCVKAVGCVVEMMNFNNARSRKENRDGTKTER